MNRKQPHSPPMTLGKQGSKRKSLGAHAAY